MGGASVVQQVEVGEQLGGAGGLGQGEAPGPVGLPEEPLHAFRVQIGQGCAPAGRGVERTEPDDFVLLEVANQRGIDAAHQLRRGDKSTADQLMACLADEVAHLGMLAVVGGALDEDHARLAQPAGMKELAVGGRQPLGVLGAIPGSEQAQVKVASGHLVEVRGIGADIGRGQVLEQEHLEEPAQQRIAMDVVPQQPPFDGQLLLHAAEEDAGHGMAALRGRSLAR